MKKLLLSFLLATLAISNGWALATDSIYKNVADLDSLIQMIETNYSGFPIIMQKGYGNDYQTMKADLAIGSSVSLMDMSMWIVSYSSIIIFRNATLAMPSCLNMIPNQYRVRLRIKHG